MKWGLVALLGIVACSAPVKEPEPVEPPAHTCETACANLRANACEIGEPTPEGSTCEQQCEESFDSGIREFQWDVGHLSVTEACD